MEIDLKNAVNARDLFCKINSDLFSDRQMTFFLSCSSHGFHFFVIEDMNFILIAKRRFPCTISSLEVNSPGAKLRELLGFAFCSILL